MTDSENNENTESNSEASMQPSQWLFDLKIEKLGVVKVGNLTMKALMELSPNLDPLSEMDDATFVRALMVAVSKVPTESDAEIVRKLNDDEIRHISDKDIEQFATSYMAVKKWEENDEQGSSLPSVSALARKVRTQFERLGSTTKEMMTKLNGIISPATQQLFMKNTALSEYLKELGGINRILSPNLVDAIKRINTPLLDVARANRLGELGPIIDKFKLNQPSGTMAEFSVKPAKSLVDLESIRTNGPGNKTATAVTELNQKTDKIVEIAQGMAAALGNTNEMVSQSMAQFEIKRIGDTKDIKVSLDLSSRSLRVAKYSLLLSVLIGAASLWYTYCSYQIAKEADLTSNVQTQALKDLVSIQREEKAKLQARIDSLEAEVAAHSAKNKGVQSLKLPLAPSQ